VNLEARPPRRRNPDETIAYALITDCSVCAE
jgi:hypothetical protein